MGDARREADRLADMPLEESNISARLRRSLSRAGYPTLRDAFDEEEEEVRKVVGKSFDEFTKLVDSFLDDPAKFVRLMSQERKSSAPKPAEKSAPKFKGLETGVVFFVDVDNRHRRRPYLKLENILRKSLGRY